METFEDDDTQIAPDTIVPPHHVSLPDSSRLYYMTLFRKNTNTLSLRLPCDYRLLIQHDDELQALLTLLSLLAAVVQLN